MEKEDIDESMLYEPVKSLAPMIFPTIIKTDAEELFEEEEEEEEEEIVE